MLDPCLGSQGVPGSWELVMLDPCLGSQDVPGSWEAGTRSCLYFLDLNLRVLGRISGIKCRVAITLNHQSGD